MKKLNLGSGEEYKEGWVNVDCRKDIKTDVIWNLNEFPYPFNDNQFSEVSMDMILEHLDNPAKALKEVIRISKNKAKLSLIVPHALSYSAISNIQHKSNFTENSFIEGWLEQYGLSNLKLINQEFLYTNEWKKYIPFKKYLKIFFRGIYDDIKFEFRIEKWKK